MKDRMRRRMIRTGTFTVMVIRCTTCMMECFQITGYLNLLTAIISILLSSQNLEMNLLLMYVKYGGCTEVLASRLAVRLILQFHAATH